MLFLKIFGFFFLNWYCSITLGMVRCRDTTLASRTTLEGMFFSALIRFCKQEKCLDTNCKVCVDKDCNIPEVIFRLINEFFFCISEIKDSPSSASCFFGRAFKGIAMSGDKQTCCTNVHTTMSSKCLKNVHHPD